MATKTKNLPKTTAPKAAVQPDGYGSANGKSEEHVRLLAYLKWEAAGKPHGDGLCYWVEAERELLQQ